MAITYTDNLTLPIVPADNQDWASDYNTMIEKLDRNPGIRIVADETAMVALTTFTGRMCWRTDLSQYWYYDGTQWAVLPGQEEGDLPAFMPMKDTVQEVTAEVAAEGSQDGTIDFDYYPGVGEEVQLYMLKVTLDADSISVAGEEVIMEEETAKRLEHKHDRSLDETGDEVDNIVVKADDEGDPVTVTDEPLTLTGYDPQPLANKNHDDTQVTITAVVLDDGMDTSCTENEDYVASLSGEGYTQIERAEDTPEQQKLGLNGADGGTYKLGTDLGEEGEDSATLNWNDDAATIETALEGIFGAGNVTVEDDPGEADFIITFDASVESSGLEFADIDLTNATEPGLTLEQEYHTSNISDPGDILVTYDYTQEQTVYIRDTDYAVTVDSSGYTNIARIDTGSIADPETVLVDYDYQPGVSGFKFKLYSEAARTNLMYELDTEQDPDWPGGIAIRDPNYGYLAICYFKDEDENGQFYYRVENLDEALVSRFKVDIKYKALT